MLVLISKLLASALASVASLASNSATSASSPATPSPGPPGMLPFVFHVDNRPDMNAGSRESKVSTLRDKDDGRRDLHTAPSSRITPFTELCREMHGRKNPLLRSRFMSGSVIEPTDDDESNDRIR